jgi:hypothetical protein
MKNGGRYFDQACPKTPIGIADYSPTRSTTGANAGNLGADPH